MLQETSNEGAQEELAQGIQDEDAVSQADPDGHVDLLSDDEDGPDLILESPQKPSKDQASMDEKVWLEQMIELAEIKLEAKQLLLSCMLGVSGCA